MLIGANVRASGGLLPALERGVDIGADVVQIFTTSPRVWKANVFEPELLEQYRLAQLSHATVRATFCHASYLINIATTDPGMLAKSRTALVENLRVSTAMGAGGLVLHLGSHLGAGFDAVLQPMADELRRALDDVEDLLSRRSGPLLMENTAGAGGNCGRDFAELAAVLEAAKGDERLGACLDTQHLFAAGVDYATLSRADAVVESIDRAIGLERLALIHLNDSKAELGSNRDRHANVGDGLIGPTALGSLLGHPRLQHLPAVLETPGAEGHGPGADDVAAARRIHAAGVKRWRRRERSREQTLHR
ncbi:MAG: deoxyribonuclease IV [Acidimicrobiales bacterium]|jgi:deoxyribonuclease-4